MFIVKLTLDADSNQGQLFLGDTKIGEITVLVRRNALIKYFINIYDNFRNRGYSKLFDAWLEDKAKELGKENVIAQWISEWLAQSHEKRGYKIMDEEEERLFGIASVSNEGPEINMIKRIVT